MSPVRILGFVALVFSALLCFTTLALAAPPLRLVSDVWPPFTDVDGKPHEALDLVHSALRRGGVKSTSSIMTWSTAVAALKQGKLDGSAAIWKTPEREEFLIFSEPYLENRLVLVGRKGEKVTHSSIAELAGERLALTKDYAYGDEVTKAANVQVVYRDNDAECLRAVLSKQADYLLLDQLMVHHLFEHYAAKANALLATGHAVLVRRPLYLAIRKDYPGAAKIIADFNRNVKRMAADGTYNVVLHVPWISADVNGDGTPEYVASRKMAVKNADPYAVQNPYLLFNPDSHTTANTANPPGYLIDGKSYNTWGDAATTLDRAGPSQGVYKYATGVVLIEF